VRVRKIFHEPTRAPVRPYTYCDDFKCALSKIFFTPPKTKIYRKVNNYYWKNTVVIPSLNLINGLLFCHTTMFKDSLEEGSMRNWFGSSKVLARFFNDGLHTRMWNRTSLCHGLRLTVVLIPGFARRRIWVSSKCKPSCTSSGILHGFGSSEPDWHMHTAF